MSSARQLDGVLLTVRIGSVDGSLKCGDVTVGHNENGRLGRVCAEKEEHREEARECTRLHSFFLDLRAKRLRDRDELIQDYYPQARPRPRRQEAWSRRQLAIGRKQP